jgi:hypothetical protein
MVAIMRALLQLRRERKKAVKQSKMKYEIQIDEVKMICIMRTSSLPRQQLRKR